MDKKRLIIILLGLILLSTVFFSGCVEKETPIKSEEDVGQAIINMSEMIEDVESTLQDIDESIG